MPFETAGQTKINVGRAQADISRGGGFGLTNEDKLNLGRAAATNLVEGTTIKNRDDEVDDDIKVLTKKVMEAANGKTLPISITEQNRKQRMMQPYIQMLLTKMFDGGFQQSEDVQADTDETEKSK